MGVYPKGSVQSKASIGVGQDGADDVDMSGRAVMITGANSGIGKEIATYAAAKRAKVYMLCRSADRAAKAKEEIVQATGNTDVEVLLADVSEVSQVKKVVTEFQSKEDKIDAIVCNAGVLLNDLKRNNEGNEITFASHLIGGSYLLSTLLIPELKAAGNEARVIYVSSGGMYNTKWPKWDQATSNGNLAYAYAKRGQVLLAERFSKDYPEIAFMSTHPGWTNTPAVDQAYGSQKKYLEPMRNAWEGAEGICWLLSTKRSNLEGGAFYLDRMPRKKHVGSNSIVSTKNTSKEVDEMILNLQKACQL